MGRGHLLSFPGNCYGNDTQWASVGILPRVPSQLALSSCLPTVPPLIPCRADLIPTLKATGSQRAECLDLNPKARKPRAGVRTLTNDMTCQCPIMVRNSSSYQLISVSIILRTRNRYYQANASSSSAKLPMGIT